MIRRRSAGRVPVPPLPTGAVPWVNGSGYMSRKIRKFRTDKFDMCNKHKFWLMWLILMAGSRPFTWVKWVKISVCYTYRIYPFETFDFFLLMCLGSVASGPYSQPRPPKPDDATSVYMTAAAPPPPLSGSSRATRLLTIRSLIAVTSAEQFGSLERIKWMREANGSFNSCALCKRLEASRLHESKLRFVSRIEMIRS